MNVPSDSLDTVSVDGGKEPSLQEEDVEKGLDPATSEEQAVEPPYSVFGKGMKIWIIFLVSTSALISPFGATTFLPALNVISDVLDITPTQVNLSITTYMVRYMYSSLFNPIPFSPYARLTVTDCSGHCTGLYRYHVRQQRKEIGLHSLFRHLLHREHWSCTTDELRCSFDFAHGSSRRWYCHYCTELCRCC